MRCHKANHGGRELCVQIFGSAGDAEWGGESVIVAVFQFLGHNVHPNLILIYERDRQQYRAIPQDWYKFFEHE
jgi:hypothetical protein